MRAVTPLRPVERSERWLDVPEIAEHLGVSVWQVRKLVREGGLPASRVGARLRFRVSRVDDWVDGREAQNGR